MLHFLLEYEEGLLQQRLPTHQEYLSYPGDRHQDQDGVEAGGERNTTNYGPRWARDNILQLDLGQRWLP
jgi:hypothetical protein